MSKTLVIQHVSWIMTLDANASRSITPRESKRTGPGHTHADTSVQAPPCRHLRAGTSVQTAPCRHCRADASVQAPPCRPLRAGTSVQAPPCRHLRGLLSHRRPPAPPTNATAQHRPTPTHSGRLSRWGGWLTTSLRVDVWAWPIACVCWLYGRMVGEPFLGELN